MPRAQRSDQDFQSTSRILNLPQGTTAGHPVEFAQFIAALEGISWKSSVRVASTANINLSAPGATIDAVTMVSGDRFLPKDQTTTHENGIYIWNGAATPATRALDASTYRELEGAVVKVEEGTSNAGTQWRQTGVNGTIGSTAVTWVSDTSSAPPASETVAGVAEIATQAETDAGTDDTRMLTPLKFAQSPLRRRTYAQTFGDGSATSYAITHSLGTTDVDVTVRVVATGAEIDCDVTATSTSVVTLAFSAAVALNSLRVKVGT